jgi:hypothetical protein
MATPKPQCGVSRKDSVNASLSALCQLAAEFVVSQLHLMDHRRVDVFADLQWLQNLARSGNTRSQRVDLAVQFGYACAVTVDELARIGVMGPFQG